jgi:hypothetical protein
MARELMRVLTVLGVQDLEVTDPAERSLLGSYWNEVRLFLENRPSDLDRFSGVRIAGWGLVTNPAAIEALGWLGVLDFDEIYTMR